jgi:hypothetical protein
VNNTGTVTSSGAGSVVNFGFNQSSWSNIGGTLVASSGGTLNAGNNNGSWSGSGLGTITASGGTVNINGTFSTAELALSTVSVSGGGTLNITGTLDNTALVAPTGGAYTLGSGTISGGTVDGSLGALTFSNANGTLSGVTMANAFTVPTNARFTSTSGTTFTGSTTFSGGNTVYLANGTGTDLTIGSTGTWAGQVSIDQSGTGAVSMLNQGIFNHSLGASNIYGNSYSFTFNNSGTVESTAGSLTVGFYSADTIDNTGTMEANGSGATLDAGYNLSTLSNLAGNTLTGGTWIASNGGTLVLPNATNSIVTNGATTVLELSGAGSSIESGPSNHPLEQTLTTNNGTLEVLGGRNYVGTTALTNNGTIQLGGGTFSGTSLVNGGTSTLSGFGTVTPTSGGITIAGGAAVSPGSAASSQYVNTLTFGTSATFGTSGSYTFDIMNSVSPTPGVDNDTINVTGTLTVSSTMGSPFTINVESINPGTGLPGLANFSSSGTYQWTLLTATTSISGFNASDFAINTSAFANGLGAGTFFVSANSNDLYLNFTPVPEPSTWALMAAGVAVLGLAGWRRRRPATA